ncbi:Uu.00g076610.m01.CDS01 [Anthostomella pinea]|uniref:Uu.00g076610.m01.CDS01 n=1 Tax=Anthostomella pinea TaxID=933095 RepID=A0AAI8YPD1_9PEZI|nr:Uu.00g076610.m01.CDS01 [Anthostomella pinea]
MSSKRKGERSISPPPSKRKAQSSISKGAVASFFTPTSQKPKDRTAWSERAPEDDTPATLLVGRYEPENMDASDRRKRRKIAAFDLDSTLIVPASGKKFGNDPGDWKWWDSSVPSHLKELYKQKDYRVVILSNQAGLTLHPHPNSKAPKNAGKAKVSNFKQKCSAVLAQLDLPTTVYAATARDNYRKPRTGMWKEVCEDYDIPEHEVDLENSVFVGDAGGRTAQLRDAASGAAATGKDFSCSDRNLAHNIGIPYKTPEEFFLGEPPREFTRDFDLATYPYPEQDDKVLFERTNKQDIVLFCGPPGAGKSTFYWKHLKPLGYERVNQDILKSRTKCFKTAAELLGEGNSVAIVDVDNTNPDADGRKEWIEFAQKHDGVPIRCVWFKIPKALCEHNDVVRALNKTLNPEARAGLPGIAFNGYFSRFREPKVKEGFQDVVEIEFSFRGTKEDYALWARYWN